MRWPADIRALRQQHQPGPAAILHQAKLAQADLRQKVAVARTLDKLKDIGFKHGRWLDTVLLQCQLGKGSCTLPDSPVPGR